MASLNEWAAAADNDDEDDAGQEFMVSSLPLVFCNGRPMALENIPERNLVTFVRFMLKCALGVDESQLKLVRRPTWWPRTIPYFNFRANKEVHKGHAERLRELVRCCFRGHRCEMLLKFCGDLERQCASGSMLFKNNFDGTSSLYERRTNRLVVTCRNENLEYDGTAAAGALSPRRLLLPRLARGPGAQLAMVQPPPTDIYLCDSCSAEFTSIDQVKAHERECGASPDDGPLSDAESTCSEPEVQCHDQTRFLSYVGLVPADGTGRQPYASPAKQRTHPSNLRRKRGFSALSRYQPVDVSSPLGLRLATGGASSDLSTACEETERYCDGADRKRVARQPTFPVVWRPPRVRGRVVHAWNHLFTFTAAQRAERRRTIRTGLTVRSRRLVSAVVPCSVRLSRVSPEVIAEACRPKTRSPAPSAPAASVWTPPPSAPAASVWTPPPSAPAASVWTPPPSVQGVLFRPVSDHRPPETGRAVMGAQRPRPQWRPVTRATATTGTPLVGIGVGRLPPAATAVRGLGHRRGAGAMWNSAVGGTSVARGVGDVPAGLSTTTARLRAARPRPAARPLVVGTGDVPTGLLSRLKPLDVAPLGPASIPGQPPWAVDSAADRQLVAGGPVDRPTLVAGIAVAPPPSRGPVGNGAVRRPAVRPLAALPAPRSVAQQRGAADTGGRPPGAETLVIDLCSSSDDEDGRATPPARQPLARLKPAASPTTAVKCASDQSKNARSHWPRSCGGSANGGSTAPRWSRRWLGSARAPRPAGSRCWPPTRRAVPAAMRA